MSVIESHGVAGTRRPRPKLEDHPQQIELANGVLLVRDDVAQKGRGQTPKTGTREDKRGAPHLMLAGVKYRPQPAYDNWFLEDKVVRRGQEPRRRRVSNQAKAMKLEAAQPRRHAGPSRDSLCPPGKTDTDDNGRRSTNPGRVQR
jgi:hypothetical protein